MRSLRRCLSILLVAGVTACNNYNLRDHLENPGGNNNERFNDRLFIFVTSQMTQGDMLGLSAGDCGGSGIGRADCVCQALAAQNGWRMSATSRFIAWLSTSVDAAKCRMLNQGGGSCTPIGPFVWYNTNYEPVFNSFESSTQGLLGTALALTAAPRYTESRLLAPSMADNVWTGTASGGLTAGLTCNDWTANTSGSAARTGTSDNFTGGMDRRR